MAQKPIRILIPDAGSVFSIAVIRGLGREGSCRVAALSSVRWPASRFSRFVDRFDTISPNGSWLEQVRGSALDYRADVVLPVDEVATRRLADARDHGKLDDVTTVPLPTTGAFDIAADKWELARFLASRKIPGPETRLLELDAPSDLRFPVLLKPRRGSNGAGIRRFDSRRELEEFLSRQTPPAGAFIVQEWIEGADIDLSLLAIDGRIVAHTIQRPFVEESHGFQPAGLVEFVEAPEVLAVGTDFVRALRWSGILHVDMRLPAGQNRPMIVDPNPRFWGSLAGSLLAGVNFPALACRLALGRSVNRPVTRYGWFASGSRAVRGLLRRPFALESWKDARSSALRLIASDPGPALATACKRLSRPRGRAWFPDSAASAIERRTRDPLQRM